METEFSVDGTWLRTIRDWVELRPTLDLTLIADYDDCGSAGERCTNPKCTKDPDSILAAVGDCMVKY